MHANQFKSQQESFLFRLCCALVLSATLIIGANLVSGLNYQGSQASSESKAVLLSTGNEIKVYQYIDGEILRFKESISRPDDDRTWITAVDYYFDTDDAHDDGANDGGTNDGGLHRPTAEPYTTRSRQDNDSISLQHVTKPPTTALNVLWLDANSNAIYKLRMQRSASEGKIVLSSASSRKGTTIYVNHQHRLNLGHRRDRMETTAPAAQNNNITAYDFTVDRQSKKLFVSSTGPISYQLSMISLLDLDFPEKVFAMADGPATHLQVDHEENVIFYMDRYSHLVRLSLLNGSTSYLKNGSECLPKTFTLDTTSKRLYWITEEGAIWSMPYNGTDRRCVTLLTSRRTPFEPFSMKFINGRLYFSDITKRSLFSVDVSEYLQSSTVDKQCASSQRPDSVLIVESPTVYGFHFIDSIVPQNEEEEQQQPQLQAPKKISDLHGVKHSSKMLLEFSGDRHTHNSVNHVNPMEDEYYFSARSLDLTPTSLICLASLGSIFIVAIMVFIIFKKKLINSEGLRPIVDEV